MSCKKKTMTVEEILIIKQLTIQQFDIGLPVVWSLLLRPPLNDSKEWEQTDTQANLNIVSAIKHSSDK